MLRLIAQVLLLAVSASVLAAFAAAPPLTPSPNFPAHDGTKALVWLHQAYGPDDGPTPPPEPDWVGRLAARGWDIWRFDRTPGRDPLAAGAEGLARGLAGLRAAGYRRVVVAGHSRGAFIALSALAHPDLVDAVIAVQPAAHGTSPARRAQAMADFCAALTAGRGVPLAYVALREDPFDPDPAGRVAAARAVGGLVIDHPDAPTGHMGGFDAEFDARFGAALADFAEDARPVSVNPAVCPQPAPR